MKKSILTSFFVCFALLLVVSCKKDSSTLYARFSSFDKGSKMTVSGFRPLWNGDETVIVNGQSYQVSSVSSSGESVSITGVLSAAVYNAVYPAEYFQNGMQYFEVPRVQKYELFYDDNQVAHQLIKAPMGAFCTESNPSLLFTPMGSLLEITVTNNTGRSESMMVDSVAVEASNVALWGAAQVNDLDLSSRSFTFRDNNSRHRAVVASLSDEGSIESIGHILSSGSEFSVYAFVPSIDNTIDNRFTISVYAHIIGDNSAVEYSYTMSQSNPYSGSLPKGCLAVVPFTMNLDNQAEIRPFDFEDCLVPGWFSVGEDNNGTPIKVRFAKGNLQYQPSTNLWRIAEHQYDFVGNSVIGNVYEGGVKCSNTSINNTYTGWMDLFGFGTSGYNNKVPTLVPGSESYYWDNNLNNLNGADGANYDWGWYNRISNGGNEPNQWRTLTKDEWQYLLNRRIDGSKKYVGLATITVPSAFTEQNSVTIHGLIILCDSWDFNSNQQWTYYTNATNGFSDNVYSYEQWLALETSGALFLPASGWRIETVVRNVDEILYYWASTITVVGTNSAGDYLRVYFDSNNRYVVQTWNDAYRYYGYSVRLVKAN